MRPIPPIRNRFLRDGILLPALAVALLLLGAAAEPACAAAAAEQPAAYLAADHPAWEDLEALWNRGGLRELPLFTRPLPRSDVAAALAGTLAERPDLRATGAARRALREFAFELERLGVTDAPRETPPLLTFREGDALLRVRSRIAVGGDLADDDASLREGTHCGFRVGAYLPGRTYATAELLLEKIVDDNPLGDSLVKGSDWYLNANSAYVSLRLAAVDVWAGLAEHRWGPGTSGTLLLGTASLPYPGLAYGVPLGTRARFTAVTASLHRPEGRWFSAHRLELAVTPTLRLGLHEAAAYASDGLDPLYAIGLVPYTLVQRILDRTTAADGSVREHRNNVLAGIDLVWLARPGLRLDGEILIDDLTTETGDQPHRLAFQGGASWAGTLFGAAGDARLEVTKVYRYTYAVDYGANFLHDDVPLGWGLGPDTEHGTLFVERDVGPDLRLGLGADVTRRGEGYAGETWQSGGAAPHGSAGTLSGTVETSVFPHVRAGAFWRDVLRLRGRLGVRRTENADHVSGEDRTILAGEITAQARW